MYKRQVFGLFNAGVISYGDSQKLPAHTLMATGITDAKGNLTFSGMYPQMCIRDSIWD